MTDRGEKDFFELLDALSEWPKLPSPYILSQLGSYASKSADHDDWARGKVIQRELPMGRISYSHECEKGAGFWDRITKGEWRNVPDVLSRSERDHAIEPGRDLGVTKVHDD